MTKKILVILGHPNKDTLGGALAASYRDGAAAAGAEVRELFIGDLQFDPILRLGYKAIQELEPDLVAAQESIKWADHLVWVYPIWWGTMPALLKGFLDRTFLPGFGFKYRENSPWWDKLLAGRSARMIVTLDAPAWYDRLMYGAGGRKTMRKAVLQFCGIKPVGVTTFGSVKSSDDAKRKKWLAEANDLGRRMI